VQHSVRALISDIHANLEALEAVLRAISAQGVDEVWCLGDIVGYGPNPKECLDLVERNCSLCLLGNHDWAVLNSPVSFNSIATRMIYRTKEWLQTNENSSERDKQRWAFIEERPLREIRGEFLMVHASPRAELSEYILPSDVQYDRTKLNEILSMVERYCAVGHTHVPCCITEELELTVPDGNGFTIELDERKAVVNTGSVGQPRDGDNRACYAVVDERRITWHRVPYRFDRTAAKLSELGEDYGVLGYRLSIGR
jgi:predicted phosphodiesterase